MTNIQWTYAVDGDFANAASWSGDVTPGAGDNAVLGAAGGAFTVSSTVNEVVMGVQLAANATLAVSGGTFTASAGTDGGVNAGVIAITNGAELAIGGTIDNIGGITLSGAGSAGSTMLLTSATTLTGGGQVALASSGYAYQATIAGVKKASLTNVDNTISGYGDIGAGPRFHLINDAAGVIEATGGEKSLTLGSLPQPGLKIRNHGVIEAATGSVMHIYGATITGHGGQIATQSAAVVSLVACTVVDQTLKTAQGSSIDFINSTITAHGAMQNASGVRLENSTLTLTGATTLSSSGYIDLSSGAKIIGASAGVTLLNEGNAIGISGANLGGGALAISNTAGGSITGYGSIDTGANTIINAGAIVASNGRVAGDALVVSSAIDNTGTLDAGSSVGGATLVAQGAVSGAGDLLIQAGVFGGSVADFASSFSEDVSFVQAGHSEKGVNPVSTLELAQSQGFTGSITGFSDQGLTALDLDDIAFVSADEATFSGNGASGVLTVTDGVHTAHITLVGDLAGQAFTASSDGHGGTVVAAGAQTPANPHAFIAAMASLGAPPAFSTHTGEAWSARETMLSLPRVATA